MKRTLRVALADTGGKSWTGGLTYQLNLLDAALAHAPQLEFVILSNDPNDRVLQDRDGKQLSSVSPTRGGAVSRFANRVTCRFLGYDFLTGRALRAAPGGKVDVIFPGRFRVGGRVAVLAWIPDFQHLHLPGMYPPGQAEALTRKFKEWSERATLVVLSSQDAERDFRSVVPQHAGKARVMHFVARIPGSLYEVDPAVVLGRYHLPEKFVYLPNQFWRHKNHEVVVKALALLKQKGVTPFVVCSGNPVDSRNPTFFASLLEAVSRAGVRDQIAFLGLVPHDDVYLLIRQATCVLNPSFFEGWSTTVEEAKSVGKRLILSDIAVHREQNPPAASYFDPKEPADLADKLGEVWGSAVPGPDAVLENDARLAFDERMKEYAMTFLSIAREACSIARGAECDK